MSRWTQGFVVPFVVVAALAAGVPAVGAAPAVASVAAAPPVAAVGLTVSADSARLVRPARTSVVLSGRYSCGPFAGGAPDRGVVDLSIVQVQGRRTVTAIGYLEPTVCDGTGQPFATTLTVTGTRRLQVGAATWSASGYVEGDTGLQHVSVPPTAISLRR